MRFECPLDEVQTPFGPLAEPFVDCRVHTPHGLVPFRFFLDTGADVTMLSPSAASFIGLRTEGAPMINVRGIEGGGISASLTEITLRLGDVDVTVPCLVSPNDDTPYLLGRAGIFDRFNIFFDNGKRMIV